MAFGNSSQSAPGDITAPPILSDQEIDSIIQTLFSDAFRNGGTDQSLLAQLSTKINIALSRKSTSEEKMISAIDEVFQSFIDFSLKRFESLVSEGTSDDAREFIYFINFLLKLLKIKKVYNNIPRQDFTRFAENTDHTQILQITLPRGEDLGTYSITHGGSCHNWSIIFKQYFDQLGIRSSIIFCNPFSNHSFTLIELKGRYYIFDPILRVGDDYLFEITDQEHLSGGSGKRNKVFVGMDKEAQILRILDNGEGLNLDIVVDEKEAKAGERGILSCYNNVFDFTCDLDSREIEYIILGYRLEDGRGFKIDFGREGGSNLTFSVSLGDKEKEESILAEIQSKTFIIKFLKYFLGRDVPGILIDQLLRQYTLSTRGQENNLGEIQSQIMSEEEISRLADWIGESTNFQLFEVFFSQFSSTALPGLISGGKKKEELRNHFQKSTELMHKRSVVKFLLLGALVPCLEDIRHISRTYQRVKVDEIKGPIKDDIGDILCG